MENNLKINQIIGIVSVLVLAVIACNLPNVASEPATEQSVEEVEDTPIVFSTPEDAIQPLLTNTVSVDELPDITYSGVSFSFSDLVAKDAYYEVIPEFSGEDVWFAEPEHLCFYFNDYAAQNSMHTASICIYEITEYIELSPDASVDIATLKTLVAARTTDVESIPFLPYWNAAQIFHARMDYLDFQNGSGVRFLTQYGQAVSNINNNSLFYTYQGVTSDDRFYISAIFPVAQQNLPDGWVEPDDWDDFSNNFLPYLEERSQFLTDANNNTFTPPISELDALIQSLKVQMDKQ